MASEIILRLLVSISLLALDYISKVYRRDYTHKTYQPVQSSVHILGLYGLLGECFKQ